jgi:hypothetical protein
VNATTAEIDGCDGLDGFWADIVALLVSRTQWWLSLDKVQVFGVEESSASIANSL